MVNPHNELVEPVLLCVPRSPVHVRMNLVRDGVVLGTVREETPVGDTRYFKVTVNTTVEEVLRAVRSGGTVLEDGDVVHPVTDVHKLNDTDVVCALGIEEGRQVMVLLAEQERGVNSPSGRPWEVPGNQGV